MHLHKYKTYIRVKNITLRALGKKAELQDTNILKKLVQYQSNINTDNKIVKGKGQRPQLLAVCIACHHHVTLYPRCTAALKTP